MNRIFFVTLVLTAVGGFAQPSTTNGGVVNANSYQDVLASDCACVIFGTELGPASIGTAAPPNYPNSLGGTSIMLVAAAGGGLITAKNAYVGATQVASFLQSSVAPQTYNVIAAYDGQTSAPQSVTVVALRLPPIEAHLWLSQPPTRKG